MMSSCASVANVLTDVWDASVWVPGGVLEGVARVYSGASGSGEGGHDTAAGGVVQSVAEEDIIVHSNATNEVGATTLPTQASLGAAYFSRWSYRSYSYPSSLGGPGQGQEYEEEIRALLEVKEAERIKAVARGRSPRPGGANGSVAGGPEGVKSPVTGTGPSAAAGVQVAPSLVRT
jgi:hypothetical protein